MIGPVLYQELLLGSRGNKQYIFRWAYAGWLVVVVLFLSFIAAIDFTARRNGEFVTAQVANSFVPLFVVQQLILMVLAVPALAASAITDEKTRGTLQYLLTTELTPGQILVGKLLARSAQVLVLALTGLPLFCFLGVIGGVEPLALFAVGAITVVPLLALASATLLASVWCRQTREAVLGLYGVGLVAGLVVFFVGGPLDYFDPLYVLEPGWGKPDRREVAELGRRLLWSMAAWGSVGVACLSVAVWRLRPAYVRQMESAGRQKRARWWRVERAAVDEEDPVPWRERHVEGLSPTAGLRRVPRWLGMAAVFTLTVVSSLVILYLHLAPGATLARVFDLLRGFDLVGVAGLIEPAGAAFLLQALVALFVASLAVGIRCSGAVSGEREKQTWEALLLTPLTARQLIRGKLRGIMGATFPYLLAYAVPAVAFASLADLSVLAVWPLRDLPMALFWTVLWLVTTFLAMYFIGAAGLYCSVRAKTSWRSLLGTLGIGYVGGFLVFLVVSPVTLIVALFIWLLLKLADSYVGSGMVGSVATFGEFYIAFLIATSLVLAAAFWGIAYYFLNDAQRWVAERERTRYWREEPYLRRRSRPVSLPRYSR